MLSSAPVLLLPPPSEPLVLLAARAIAVNLASGEQITRRQLHSLLTDHFGGTDAEGRWSVRDAHVALELAQTACLLADAQISLTTPAAGADGMFAALEKMAPAQTNRSEEQIEWQQFATPPRLAWLAARACALIPHELVLEPSAGTGMLAVWAAKAGTRLALNEISPLRRDCLSALFPDARLTGHDAELIDELLDPAIAPSVVLMNPPYSHGIERGHDTRTGARHLRSAWSRLANGGRLVAIMPEWFDCPKFLAGLKGPVSLRLNAAIERAFIKQGTGITTRLLILDKVQSSVEPVAAHTNDFVQLVDLVDALPGRAGIEDAPAQSGLPVRTPFRLVVSSRRPLSAPAKLIPATPMAIGPLTYRTLDAPAPIAPQVGHYLPYRPSRIVIDGAAEHPTPLVESVAMGSIAAPIPGGVPQIPDGLVAKGLLSAAQAETLIYGASAHARDLPGRYEPEDKGCSLQASADGRVYRQGYFLGDGTGAGKGRQVASVILDRWVRGERRHIWISKNEALLEDARRDWAALGGLPIDIQPLASWKLSTPIAMRDGILFVTYPTLRSGRNDATRLDQILAWAGEDFEGVIVLDEAHAMANAAGGEGSRGKVKGSEQGIAGVRLQNLLPRARVLYASATGASDVNNLAYATRLGLWGPETAFANREAFVTDIRDGGIAAMELVARDLKSLGLYTARALSFAGVEYDILEHCLTEEQIAVYDAYAEAWAIIHANLREALEATRIVDSETGGTLNSGAKSAALSIFEGTKRFFAQLLLSMKLPSLLPAIDAAIADGHAVVVQLVSTAEAMLERRLADLSDEERQALEIDLSPREYVIDYLSKSFPVRLMAVFTDENGNPRSEPMSDEQGAPVLCRSALSARDRMIEQLCALPPIATALDAIIERFGVDQVAEVTGRTRRLIIGRDGRQCLKSRSPRANVAETQAFMDGAKRILVFSDAGGTGRSYHADLAAKNKARRVHFLLEPGWRADAAIQGLGRTNRTNQASAPLFRPVTTDVRGERRFISTIARRLDSLGALTRGQRQTGGQNLFDPADNLESTYAKEALHRWFGLLFSGKLEAVSLGRFQELTGLRIEAPDGSMVDDLPSIQRWLNRILALPIALQNAIFDEFMGLVEARIDAARQAGTLDLGLETIAVEGFTVLSDTLLRTDPASGATTHLLELEIARALKPLTLKRLEELHGLTGQRQRPVRNARSGRVALLVPARSILADDGTRVARLELLCPLKRSHITEDQLAESSWEDIAIDAFCDAWSSEVEEARTSHKRERLYLATGLLLPVWDKLPSDFVRVSRISAADGRSLLGREVPVNCVPELCRALGLGREQTLSADDIVQTVLATGRAMQFAGREQLMVKRSLVNGSQRLELTGWSAARLDWYKAQGCFTEIIRYQTRLFVPIEGAASAIAKLAA